MESDLSLVDPVMVCEKMSHSGRCLFVVVASNRGQHGILAWSHQWSSQATSHSQGNTPASQGQSGLTEGPRRGRRPLAERPNPGKSFLVAAGDERAVHRDSQPKCIPAHLDSTDGGRPSDRSSKGNPPGRSLDTLGEAAGFRPCARRCATVHFANPAPQRPTDPESSERHRSSHDKSTRNDRDRDRDRDRVGAEPSDRSSKGNPQGRSLDTLASAVGFRPSARPGGA